MIINIYLLNLINLRYINRNQSNRSEGVFDFYDKID